MNLVELKQVLQVKREGRERHLRQTQAKARDVFTAGGGSA